MVKRLTRRLYWPRRRRLECLWESRVPDSRVDNVSLPEFPKKIP